MNIDFTNGQKNAIKTINIWHKLNSSNQYFIIHGYAGTGKTTIIRHFLKMIGLELTNVKFVAFTGKAALVMHSKGLPATTIHKLIYDTFEEEYEVMDKEGNKKKKTRLKFVKKTSLDEGIKLIVLDECSMISDKLWDDLLSFNIQVIVLGDPGQLPPVQGKSPFDNLEPDAFLDEVVRQAEGDPIIHLATLARQGKRLPYGNYGPNAYVDKLDNIRDSDLLQSDIVITTTNQLRDDLNNYIRELKGFKSKLPEINDKLICRKNNWDEGTSSCPLVNGLIGYNQEIIEISNDGKTFDMVFKPEISKKTMSLSCNVDMFNAQNNNARQEIIKNRYSKGEMFEFGYAITSYLSQGSEYKDVTIYHVPFGNNDLRRKLLYTEITRSQKVLRLYL